MKRAPGIHEDFSRPEKIKSSTDRNFGLVFASVFALLAAMSWWTGGQHRHWWLAAAVIMLAIAVVRPSLLGPLNVLWTKFGVLIVRFVSPVALALIYVTTIVPIGFYLRARGRDLLRLKFSPDSDSYWIPRQPPGPTPESMSDQF